MNDTAKSPPNAIGPWQSRGSTPQRYSVNYKRYLSLDGKVPVDEWANGFVAGGANQDDKARFFFFCLVFDQLLKEGLEGDLAELGVYKGCTGTLLAAMARKLGRTAYLLDTFEGFHPNDLIGIDSEAKSEAFSDTSLNAVRAFIGDDNVCYVKGYFPDTAAQLPSDGRYCLVHIDCDLYLPVLRALEYFYPRMVPGGFLIVHDYSSLWYNGPAKAVDEFFASKAEAPSPLPDSAGSVVVRKARRTGAAYNWLLRKRAALLRSEWAPAGKGALSELLGPGWGGPEAWGVWGVGEAHELRLAFPRQATGDMELDCDVHVLLAESRTTQHIEVTARGEMLALWAFTEESNRGVRTVRIPAAQLSGTEEGYKQLSLLLKPREIGTARRLANVNDDRPLSVALHRIRCRIDAAS